MSWRDARARVNSGFYKPKEESPLATGFAAAADIVAKSWMQDAADEKAAEKERLEEEKAERKRVREEQREKEKKDQENRATAKAAIAQAQLPSSPEIFQQAFVMAQGGADQSKIYDYFISGINKGDIEMVGPEQGPGMPRNTSILTDLESGSGGANALLNQSQNSQFSDINVSTMPISKVMAFQQKRGPGSYHAWSKENMPDGTEAKEKGLGSTPVGKYQFIGDTLKDLKENGTLDSLGITDDTIFDEKTQDAIFVRYAQDRLKGKTTDEERITEMRNIWEGLKKASDEQVLSVIAGIETGTFNEGEEVEDRSMMKGETAIFNPPEREFDPVDISGIKTFEDWSATNANINANKMDVDPEFMTFFKERGENLKALQSEEKLDEIFSMDALLADDMTASKLKDRITLAEAKGIKVPEYLATDVLPILEQRRQYTDEELIDMSPDKRMLIAKFSTDPSTQARALEIDKGQKEIRKPIEWSTITKDNFEGNAKELEDAGDADGAKRVREYGKVISADKPLSIVELGKLDSVVLDALSSTVTDADYKSRIDDIRVRKSAQATKENIDSFDIMKYNNADASVLQTAIDAAESGPIKVQLEALKKHRENNPDNIELDMSAGFLITTYTVDGETFVATTAPTKNGQLYDVDRQQLIPANAAPESKNVKMIGAQASLLAQMNDKILVPLTESRREMAYMLESAQRLEKFVDPAQGGKPEILTTVGGDVTRGIERLGNEYNALNKLFLGGASEAEVFSYIDTSLDNLGETASIASQFQAEVLKFAYLYATVSLEQRGAGLSNTDFANALKIVQAGSDYKTFSSNLRARSKEGIGKVEGRISDITSTDGQIKLLDLLDPSGNLSSGYKISAQDYLTGRGLGDMYTYANSAVTAPIEDPTKTVPKNKPVGQRVSEYKGSDTFAADKKKYDDQSPENQLKWAEIMSITHNIPVELIIKAYGGGSN